MRGIGPALAVAGAAALLALATTAGALPMLSAPVLAAPASGSGTKGGTSPGGATKGGAATGKGLSGPVMPGGAVGGRQPCDLRTMGGFRSRGGFGFARIDGPVYLIVDARPPGAQVFPDGRLLATAADLVARALPLAPGKHAIEIVAAGFRPYVAQFRVVPGSFPVRLRVHLPPE